MKYSVLALLFGSAVSCATAYKQPVPQRYEIKMTFVESLQKLNTQQK